MSEGKVWSDGRRRIVSKTLFDIFKIEVAATFASKFFAEFSIAVKILMIGVMLGTLVLGFVVYPKEGD